MHIKFAGADKLNAALKRMAANCPKEFSRFMRMEAEKVKGRVKNKTPVDTGRLRNSWTSTVSGATAEIFTPVEYGGYVEFGHRVKIHGKFTGTVVPGRFMLRDGVQESADNFVADAEKIMARIFT